jgi:sRNA-binding regulator protein Hfq
MSLGDHLRYLRAMRGGVDTITVAKAIGIDRPWPITEIEVRYRQLGDDELVAKLAEYYDRPVEELFWHREHSRKKLSQFLQKALYDKKPVSLNLRSGETLNGMIQWWDLGSVGIKRDGEDRITVIQRHAVIDWE